MESLPFRRILAQTPIHVIVQTVREADGAPVVDAIKNDPDMARDRMRKNLAP
jgi:hypothetical protein